MIKYILIGSILSAALGSMAALWQIQIPTNKPTATMLEDNWKLPALLQTTHIQKTYIKLRKLEPWGSDQKNKRTNPTKAKKAKEKQDAKKQQRPDWRFTGIVQQGDKRYILFLDKFNKVTQYASQSSLPNGARLVRIHNDFIEVLQDGELKTIRLYNGEW